MPNSLIAGIREILRAQGLEFEGEDDELTSTLGSLNRPELFERFPDFKKDWDDIREARSPGTIGGIVNTAKSAFDRSVQAKNVLGGIGETDAGDIAERERRIQDRPSSVPWEDWQTAKGADAVKVFLRDPVEIVSNIVAAGISGSLPALAGGLAGGVAGASVGPVGGIIGAGIGTGAGSLAVEYGGKYLETLREAGADLADPDSILRVVSDPEVRARASEMGLRRGLPVAVFDAASAGLAGKFLKGVRTASAAQNIRRGAAEAALQGGLGGGGEVAGAISAGERISPGAVFEEIVGELGPGAVEVGGAALRQRMAAPSQPLSDIPQNIQRIIPSIDAPVVAETPSVLPIPSAPVVSPERRVSMMSSEQMAARLAELSPRTDLFPVEQQELELLRAFLGTVETAVAPLPVVVPPATTTTFPAATGATGVELQPNAEIPSAPVAANPENGFLAPAPVSPESGDIQYTIQREQEFEGRTIPGYVQIERQANNGRGEPLTDAERAAIPQPPSWLPTGRYTAVQVAEAVASGPPAGPSPFPAPAPAAIADVTPNTEAFAGAAPVVEAVPPSAPAPVEPAITPAPPLVAEAGAVAPEAPTTLADQLVKIQARRAKTGEIVEVEMPAVKAEKLLNSRAETLRKLIDCLAA